MVTKDELKRLGDVNGDGVIDQKDIDLIAAYAGYKVGDPEYDVVYDLNQDGKITVVDYTIAILNLGLKAEEATWEIWFPGLTIPGLKIARGRFLNISLFGVGIVVPPIDLTFWNDVVVWKGFKLFDIDWIVSPIIQAMQSLAGAVWDLFQGTLDGWAEEFYTRRGEERE